MQKVVFSIPAVPYVYFRVGIEYICQMKLKSDTHLHSREHLLADDLSQMMLEPKRFAAYLGIAKLYEESELRALARRVLEKRDLDPKSRGKYFFGALRSFQGKELPGPLKQNSRRVIMKK